VQRLASLLAKGSKAGLSDKVLLSGLRCRDCDPAPGARAAPGGHSRRAQQAVSPSARSKRVEHGSNALLKSLATFARHYPFYTPKLASTSAASPKRRVEHGSSSLLRMLTGQTGDAPSKGRHPNTLFYHASAPSALQAPASASSARKVAVTRGRAVAGTALRGIKKQADSWFWPLNDLF
jgi:hypothetical protein